MEEFILGLLVGIALAIFVELFGGTIEAQRLRVRLLLLLPIALMLWVDVSSAEAGDCVELSYHARKVQERAVRELNSADAAAQQGESVRCDRLREIVGGVKAAAATTCGRQGATDSAAILVRYTKDWSKRCGPLP